jgi:putative ATPase
MDKKTPELFQNTKNNQSEPLAARMRPRTLEEFIGQDHILGVGRLLRRAIQADQLSSLLLYGPPGTGKTTLARVIANSTKSFFISINAVLAGVKEIREAIKEANDRKDLYDRKTILFVDEVHRWNKAQQDALLPWVENGLFILIGATTENPFFEVNKALVSRSRIFQLKNLEASHLETIIEQCLTDTERGYGKYHVSLAQDARNHLIKNANGDARTLLNALELAVETTPERFPPSPNESIAIDLAIAEESIQKKALLYDKDGDYHFDIISAFIKSIRGSDVDAALFWMARMIHSGEDPRFIFRRMLISAAEDIGMADPRAISVVESHAAAFDRVGLPEGQFFLANACIYLATAKKSNSSFAYFEALARVQEKGQMEVPIHVRDSSRDKDGLGHGANYKYPHAFTDHWVAQQYLPDELTGMSFYQPGDQGYEGEIAESVIHRRAEQLDLILQDQDEIISFGPSTKQEDRWHRRIEAYDQGFQKTLVHHFRETVGVDRNYRFLLLGSPSFSFAAFALAASPEGLVQVHWNSEQAIKQLIANYESFESLRRPQASFGSWVDIRKQLEPIEPNGGNMQNAILRPLFDCIIVIYNPDFFSISKSTDPMPENYVDPKQKYLDEMQSYLSGNGLLYIISENKAESSSLSEQIKQSIQTDEAIQLNSDHEKALNQLSGFEDLIKKTQSDNFSLNTNSESFAIEQKRSLTKLHLIKWFGSEGGELIKSPFTKELLRYSSESELIEIREILYSLALPLNLSWNKIFTISKFKKQLSKS